MDETTERESAWKRLYSSLEREGKKLPKLSDGGDALGHLTLEGGGSLAATNT
jgi:hypothetical protein